jgi:hypothetical protein
MIPSAAKVARLFQARYPASEVTVTRVRGGLRVEVQGNGSTIVAVVGDHERSAILAALTDAPSEDGTI